MRCPSRHCTEAPVESDSTSVGDQRSESGPMALRVVFAMEQNGPAGSADALTSGSGFTVTVTVSVESDSWPHVAKHL
jgi:hypothetical protein